MCLTQTERSEGKEGMILIMKILAIDTSSNIATVALLEDDKLIKEKHINDFYQRYILVKNIDGNNIDAHLDAVINNA
mgnify:CR=1 FL=1